MKAEHKQDQGQRAAYFRFTAMIATSMVVMFLLMYLNSSQIVEHAWFSETRLFMTLIMGGGMAIIMLLFMQGMYRHRVMNAIVLLTALLLLCAGVGLVRSQVTVSDADYMEGMIPHHSIAILTSERAQIRDPRVRQLADEIIAAQKREIREMEWLIHDIRQNGIAATEAEAESRAVPEFKASGE